MAVEWGDVSTLGVKLKSAPWTTIKVEEPDPETEQSLVLEIQEGNTRGLWERTVPPQANREGNEEVQRSWEARLQGFVKALESPHLDGGCSQPPRPAPQDNCVRGAARGQRATKLPPGLYLEESHKALLPQDGAGDGKVKEEAPEGETVTEDTLRLRFRHFSCREAEGPQDVCQRLRELCHQWLKPERRTKEEIVELVVLEQFLALLPKEIQSRIRAWDPETCSQAVALVEDILMRQQQDEEEEKKEVMRSPRDKPDCLPTAEAEPLDLCQTPALKEIKQEEDSDVTMEESNLRKEKTHTEVSGDVQPFWMLSGSCDQHIPPHPDFWEASESRMGSGPENESSVHCPQGCCKQFNGATNHQRIFKDQDLRSFFTGTSQAVESNRADVGPKKAAPAEAGKRTKEKITLEMKKEIIWKHDGGLRVTDLAREYGRNPSTIGTILKMREKILATDVAKGVTRIVKNRPAVLEVVEKLLLIWLEEKQRAGATVTEAVICEKAKALHADLVQQEPGASAEPEVFKASRGWFERFKTRSGIHSVVRHGEAASPDVPAAEDFATEFLEVVKTQGYLPQQVFNCDETGLFWKRMPKRTFLTQEEAKLPGHKPMKDRLTLLFCANASGDLKIKPMLVYQSENPRAFKKHKVNKDQLSVLWRSNAKAWVTRVLFVDWVNLAFGPAVKQYLLDNDLPLKAVLLMDNAPAHPPGLEGDLLEDFRFIKVMFLPPNTTPLLQPMDQQVITNFKKLYTKELFRRCFEVTDCTNLTLREFWRDHFDIVSCVKMITTAWDGISQRILNSAWRNLWPDCVAISDSDASAPAPESTVLEDIVSLGRTMGLEVTEEDVCELVEDHDQELSTQELVELQAEATQEQASLEEEEATGEEQLSSTELKDICQQWKNVQTYAQRHHPDKALARDLANTFDTRIMSSFRRVLKRRLKRQTMERFIMKKQRVKEEPAASTSGAQLPSSSSSSF